MAGDGWSGQTRSSSTDCADRRYILDTAKGERDLLFVMRVTPLKYCSNNDNDAHAMARVLYVTSVAGLSLFPANSRPTAASLDRADRCVQLDSTLNAAGFCESLRGLISGDGSGERLRLCMEFRSKRQDDAFLP